MAEIFLAKQLGPAGYERTVVIKRILPHYSSDPDFVAMFLDEARLAALLSHPNIVQIFDFGEVDGSFYLAMEHLRGADLRAITFRAKNERRPIPAQVAATILRAACEALHYAHTLTSEAGEPLHIVHRDISTSNLFVTRQGQVKVLDFGIARAEGKRVQTQTGVIKGKVVYMSPEQAAGRPIDGRADVWALGVVLFELLTGERLFAKKGEANALRALMNDAIPAPSELAPQTPAELDRVCRRALQRDVAQRYASAQEMFDDLDEFLSSRTYVPSQALLQRYLDDLMPEPERSGRSVAAASPTAVPPASPSATHETKLEKVRAVPQGVPVQPSEPTAVAAAVAPVPKPARRGLIAVGAVLAGLLTAGVVFVLRPAARTEPLPQPVRVVASPDPSPPSAPLPDASESSGRAVAAVEPRKEEAPETPAPAAQARAEPKKPTHGQLDVNCVPWCRIWIDGKDTTRNSPAFGISLSPGRHHLMVVNPPTGVTHEEDVVIRAGAITRDVVKF